MQCADSRGSAPAGTMAGELSSAKRVCAGRAPMRHMKRHLTSAPGGTVALLPSDCWRMLAWQAVSTTQRGISVPAGVEPTCTTRCAHARGGGEVVQQYNKPSIWQYAAAALLVMALQTHLVVQLGPAVAQLGLGALTEVAFHLPAGQPSQSSEHCRASREAAAD